MIQRRRLLIGTGLAAAGTLSPEAICAMVDDLIDAHGDAIDERIRAGSRRTVSPA